MLYETFTTLIRIHRINSHMEYNVGKCRAREISLFENKSTHFLGFKNIARNKVEQKLLAVFDKQNEVLVKF